jgi:hypothetical protein
VGRNASNEGRCGTCDDGSSNTTSTVVNGAASETSGLVAVTVNPWPSTSGGAPGSPIVYAPNRTTTAEAGMPACSPTLASTTPSPTMW